jgi:glycosyltransferase involved in cell wall biosynthesis
LQATTIASFMKVTLFIPVLNEVNGMKAVMPRVKPEWLCQVLIADGGSTDGSVEYAESCGYDVYKQKRKGIRYAYNEAWPLIKGDYVITFSPDGNCKPENIPSIIEKFGEGYDLVVASRYLGGLKSEDDSLLTGFGNWMFTGMINLFYGFKYTDAMGIYRGYRTSLFHELDLHLDSGYPLEKFFNTVVGLEPMVSIRAAKRKVKIAEVPGPEPARIGGHSKMLPFKWGFIILVQVFREIFFWRK